MLKLYRATLIGAALVLVVLHSHAQTKPLTNDDVIKMVKSGMDEGLIKSVIQGAPATKLDSSPDALIALKNAGVPTTIISIIVTGSAPASKTAPPATTEVSNKVQEPEYANAVFLLDSNGVLKSLERQTPNIGVKPRALGYGGVKSSMVFNGAQSPIRISSDQKPEFVMRLATTDIDPNTLIQLVALKPNKDKREWQIGKTRFMALGGSQTTLNDSAAPLSIGKYGQSSVKITITGPLPPGEYAIAVKTTQTGYCFGVDPK